MTYLNHILEGCKPIYNYLKSQSFDILSCGGSYPFQIEGNHISGFSIYLHARGERVSLTIYNSLLDYFDSLPDDSEIIWYSEWKFPDAGYISFNDAFYVFWMLWSDVRYLI